MPLFLCVHWCASLEETQHRRVTYSIFCVTHKDPVGTVRGSLRPQNFSNLDQGHRSLGERGLWLIQLSHSKHTAGRGGSWGTELLQRRCSGKSRAGPHSGNQGFAAQILGKPHFSLRLLASVFWRPRSPQQRPLNGGSQGHAEPFPRSNAGLSTEALGYTVSPSEECRVRCREQYWIWTRTT